jgi:hypothetical protein
MQVLGACSLPLRALQGRRGERPPRSGMVKFRMECYLVVSWNFVKKCYHTAVAIPASEPNPCRAFPQKGGCNSELSGIFIVVEPIRSCRGFAQVSKDRIHFRINIMKKHGIQ